ncbi:MAG: DUF362 domain-containing protein [Candidatus Jordarchaeaceae archaeon]
MIQNTSSLREKSSPLVIVVRGDDPEKMVTAGLAELDIKIPQRKIVVKPNLIANKPYPTTTSPKTVEAIIKYLKKYNKEIIIAEGAGWADTNQAYRDRGYQQLAEKYEVKLVDLNSDQYEKVRNSKALVLKEHEFPLTLKDCYLVSAAVLKVHGEAGVTLSLKNMLGATIGGNKGRFHSKGIHQSIVDINLYKAPDLAIIDGIEGNIRGELGGETKKFNVMIFSQDPVAADAVGAKILGVDPLSVKHLKLAQEKGLGIADLGKINVKELK